ncbi:MAG: glucose 1-dehydrogenase [Hyphomonadaceae bacterium]
MFELNGKTALVTGASSGLGAHFSRVLAEAGADVVLAARRTDRLESLAAEISATGRKALAVEMDVTSAESVDAGFAKIEAEMGAPADIIVNNAGVSHKAFFTEMEEDDWDYVMDANLKGVWRVAKAGANALIKAGKPGAIINTASVAGIRVAQTITAYAVSKAGVDHMTRAMALEMARYKIRVNAIAPGYFKTEMNTEFLESEHGAELAKRIPMRRTGDVHELAGPLLLLASDAGSFMTGATIVVDGGHMHAGL